MFCSLLLQSQQMSLRSMMLPLNLGHSRLLGLAGPWDNIHQGSFREWLSGDKRRYVLFWYSRLSLFAARRLGWGQVGRRPDWMRVRRDRVIRIRLAVGVYLRSRPRIVCWFVVHKVKGSQTCDASFRQKVGRPLLRF